MASNKKRKITEPNTDGQTPYHALSAEDSLAHLQAHKDGLNSAEVQRRQQQYGLNILPRKKPDTVVKVFLRQFFSPLIYVLIVAAIISMALKEWSDAFFIFAVLLVNAIIGTIQEYHAQRSAEALQKMVNTFTVVLRDDETCEIEASQLVPGDIVVLNPGSRVPADMRLLSEHDLQVDESLLTGESIPVDKDATALYPADTPLADQRNRVFAGSLVNKGKGIGVVNHTGTHTLIGQLALSLQQELAAKPPLMVRMNRFTTRIAIALAIIVVILAIIKIAQGADWHEVFLLSVALAVSAIPEGLPVALTVALAISMHRMAKRNVIVRRLVAVEALGSCTYIASDKTGTLTMNELTVQQVQPFGQEAWPVSGVGLIPEGEIHFPAGSDTNNNRALLKDICLTSVLCNESFLGKRDGEWSSFGDTVDIALLVMAHKAGCNQAETQVQYPLVDQIPYESERGFAATLNQDGNQQRIFVKGALEKLLPMCSNMSSHNGAVPLDIASIHKTNESLAKQGYRVIALASGSTRKETGIAFGEEDLVNLTLHAIVGINDPLRESSKEAIQACRRAGIKAAMVTGDHPITALAIARELGMASHDFQVATGIQVREAEEQGAKSMQELVENTHVFARVEPKQKLAIVHALQDRGHYVAVTGDGANDAPALKASQVGVAMGKRGSDVAKESADLIITNDHFETIVSGIEEGRVAYQNIRKVIFLLISTGAAEIVLFILSLLSGLPLPLFAVQLLWLNLVTNGIQDVALAFEPKEGNEMHRPPRNPREPIFNRVMIERVLLTAAVMGGVAFSVFWYFLDIGLTVDDARNRTLLLMVLFENVHVFNSRSETLSAFQHNPLRNPLLLFGTAIAQLIHIAALYSPVMQHVLHIKPVTLVTWLELLAVAFSILIVLEIHKLFLKRRLRHT